MDAHVWRLDDNLQKSILFPLCGIQLRLPGLAASTLYLLSLLTAWLQLPKYTVYNTERHIHPETGVSQIPGDTEYEIKYCPELTGIRFRKI